MDTGRQNSPLGYRPNEAAKLLGIGRTKVFELIKNQTLESVTVGRSRVIKASSLRRLLDEAA